MTHISGFVAYPSSPADIRRAISGALENLPSDGYIQLQSWEENDIWGRYLVDPILSQISESDALVADVTYLNFNVLFEVGYAIGLSKRLNLINNRALEGDQKLIRDVGIIDTLGYKSYTSSVDLTAILKQVDSSNPIPVFKNDIDKTTPLYLVLPREKSDFEVRVIACLNNHRLKYRSFDAEESGRMSHNEAIANVAKSFGVIIPLLKSNRRNAIVHNYRAAFVAGLSQGMDKELLLIQDGDEEPIPLDYRELVKSFQKMEQIDSYIAEFAANVVSCYTSSNRISVVENKTLLERLIIGASAAENELDGLQDYYIETDEYQRTIRGEIRVVTGRKGSGKTAMFAQCSSKLKENRSRVVLDLKPEGFQLLKFREQVVDLLEEGTKHHTVTAFWEYLLYLEICHKLIQNDESAHHRNHKIYEPYRELSSAYREDEYVSEGDFAERMSQLTQKITEAFEAKYSEGTSPARLMNAQITELIYKHDIKSLKKAVVEYLKFKQGIWILFDNLDKGWPPHGVSDGDVLTLQCLIEALQKIEREVRKGGKGSIDCHGVIFVRNDVYELLVSRTSDRGKDNSVVLDWVEPEMMRQLLRRRFICTKDGFEKNASFDDIWREVATTHVNGEESSQYLIDRCLMRPRALIDLLSYCRGHAVNLRHDKIEAVDILEGETAFSTDLLTNISYEMKDVAPWSEDILYEFIDQKQPMSGKSICDLTCKYDVDEDNILHLLLWYGFLGIVDEEDKTTYIYSVRYDIKRIQAIVRKKGTYDTMFRVNPAFWKALGIT